MSPWGMISQPPAESISAISPGASSAVPTLAQLRMPLRWTTRKQ